MREENVGYEVIDEDSIIGVRNGEIVFPASRRGENVVGMSTAGFEIRTAQIYDNPKDLKVGNSIESVWLSDGSLTRGVVERVDRRRVKVGSVYVCLDPALRMWRRVTARQYGATCTRCNEYNEYAEAVPGFTCYGCR